MSYQFPLNLSFVPPSNPLNPHNLELTYLVSQTHNSFQSLFHSENLKAQLYYRDLQLQQHLHHLAYLQQTSSQSLVELTKTKPEELPLKEIALEQSPKASFLPKTEYVEEKQEEDDSQRSISIKVEITQENKINTQLKTEIQRILSFIISQYGKTSNEHIIQERLKYTDDQRLLRLFDSLTQKYSSAAKCREDMIRFVLRKAISYLRDSLRQKHKLNTKAASVALCQRYFSTESEELSKVISTGDADQIVNFLLPYKKNSRNRTANTAFITQIFSSKVFYQDYVDYLKKFDGILQEDNHKKAEKFAEFLMDCVMENSYNKIMNYKRLPWLVTWLQSTKVIAYELLNVNSWKNFEKNPRTSNKKQKLDADVIDQNTWLWALQILIFKTNFCPLPK